MNIIDQPTAYLVGRQQLDRPELARFLADHGVEWSSDSDAPAEVLTEAAGRLCYLSFAKPRPGGNAAYLKHVLEVGHGSILEHAVWNFVVTGVSRSLSHELVRHRAGFSYSQLSQRYVDESVAEYVCPPLVQSCRQGYDAVERIRGAVGRNSAEYDPLLAAVVAEFGSLAAAEADAAIYREWLLAVQDAHHSYVKLADHLAAKLARQTPGGVPETAAARTELRKAARSAARSVLPNATETKVFVSVNARAARSMIELRCSRHADAEIRILAGMIWEVLNTDSPNLFGDYTKVFLPDGTFELQTPYKKV